SISTCVLDTYIFSHLSRFLSPAAPTLSGSPFLLAQLFVMALCAELPRSQNRQFLSASFCAVWLVIVQTFLTRFPHRSTQDSQIPPPGPRLPGSIGGTKERPLSDDCASNLPAASL